MALMTRKQASVVAGLIRQMALASSTAAMHNSHQLTNASFTSLLEAECALVDALGGPALPDPPEEEEEDTDPDDSEYLGNM